MHIKKYDENDRPYIQLTEELSLRTECEEVSEIYKEKARKELRETPEIVESSMAELREMLMADEQIFVPYEREDFLKMFLRPTKFYAKSAYELICRYYKFKVKYPKYSENLMPETVRRPYEHNVINLQPKRDQHGRRILILSGAKDWTPEKFTLSELFRALQVTLEAALIEPMTQINGCIIIFDMTGITFRQLQYCSIPFAMMLLEWVQHCAPLRLKAFHIVHNPSFFNMIFKFLKPFLSPKVRTRVFFHKSNLERLTRYVSPDSLRTCLGGTMICDEVDGKMIADMMMECSEEFEVANVFGYVEDKKNMKKPVIIPVSKGNYPRHALLKDVVGDNNNDSEIPIKVWSTGP